MSQVFEDGTVVLDTTQDIEFFALLSLRGACRLEAMGMKRRGRSALAVARERLGLAKRAPAELVIAALNDLIAKAKAERKPS